MKEITLKEIAEAEGLHPVYTIKLAREKGFPDPVRMIGRNKMYDPRQVGKFFRGRERAKKRRTVA